jgi:hypothetical protein
MNYSNIFNKYRTSEGIPFFNISKSISFPKDDSLEIYSYFYVSEDTSWTVLSYKIYNTIDYWWVLCALNTDFKFYAPEGNYIKCIDPAYIKDVLGKIIY